MADHSHEPFDMPAGFVDPGGREGINYALIGEFMGAAFDGCTSCQDPMLARVADDPATSARMVELACVAVQAMLGGLPQSMTDPTIPSTSSVPFRKLAAAGADDQNDAMFALCAKMDPAERREAVNTATDTLVGMMTMG